MRTATNSFSSMPICKSRHAQVAVTSGSRSSDYITVRPIDRSESGDSTGTNWRGHSSLHGIKNTLTRAREFARSFPVQSRWRYKNKVTCVGEKKRSLRFVVCTTKAMFSQCARIGRQRNIDHKAKVASSARSPRSAHESCKVYQITFTIERILTLRCQKQMRKKIIGPDSSPHRHAVAAPVHNS